MRILQLSDPHLLADPEGRCRGRQALRLLGHGLSSAMAQMEESGEPADLLLLSGDLCQDESWGGYVRLRELLEAFSLPVAVQCGNHDHPQLLRAVLGRRAAIAPTVLTWGVHGLVLLDSHRPGETGGWLGKNQLNWLERQLAAHDAAGGGPLLVSVHHPPVAIGDAFMDGIGLGDGDALLTLLGGCPQVVGVVFGHVHQHWQGALPGRPAVPLLGCPSTLCGFGPVQPCPMGRADDPGGRLLELTAEGGIRQRLLRWNLPDSP